MRGTLHNVCITLLLVLIVSTLNAQSFTATAKTVNGVCASDAQIIINADHTTGTVLYELIAPAPLAVNASKNNVFSNLPAGTYTVKVYDAAHATPQSAFVISNITVTTTYQQLSSLTATPGVLNNTATAGANGVCGPEGTVLVNTIRGSNPVVYKLIKGTDTLTQIGNSGDDIHFNQVAKGSYIVTATDACGTTLISTPVKVTTDYDLSAAAITGVSLVKAPVILERVAGAPDSLAINNLRSAGIIVLKDASGATISYDSLTLPYKVEFTSNGITSSSGWIATGADKVTVGKYVPGKPASYVVVVKNPCTGKEYRSQSIDIAGQAFGVAASNGLSDMCSPALLYATYNSANNIAPYFPVAITVKDQNSGKSYSFTWVSGSMAFPGLPLIVGHKYDFAFEDAAGFKASYSLTYKDIYSKLTFFSADACELGKVRIGAKGLFGRGPWPVKISITSAPSSLATLPKPVEINSPGTNLNVRFMLWDNLPEGNYSFLVEYGDGNSGVCRIEKHDDEKMQATNASLVIDSLSFSHLSCDIYNITGSATATRKNGSVYKYGTGDEALTAKIISGPQGTVGLTAAVTNAASPYFSFKNVPGGDYVIAINLKINSDCPSGSDTKTILLPYYKQLSFKASGIVCKGSTTGVLGIQARGTGPYTYGVKGKNDADYNWQPDSVFYNMPAGIYSVKVRNNCSEITQDVTIYDAATLQLLNASAVSICRGDSLQITSKSIGPVSNITWTYNNLPVTEGLNATSDTLTIAAFDSARNAGFYKVTLESVAGCTITDSIKIQAKDTVGLLVSPNGLHICGDGSLDLSSSAVIAHATNISTYSFYTDAQLTKPLQNYAVVNTAGTYYVKGTSNQGCSIVSPVQVTKDTLCNVTNFTTWKKVADANNNGSAEAGELLTYKIYVRNTGTAPLKTISVTDNVPAHTTFVEGGDNGGTGGRANYNVASNTVTFTAINIAVNSEPVIFSFQVKVDSDIAGVKEIANQASVTANNIVKPTCSAEAVDCKGDSTIIETSRSLSADIKVVKVSDKSVATSVGNNYIYTITVTNKGESATHNVVVTDTLSSMITYISATATNGNISGYDIISRSFNWKINDLQPGDEQTLTLTVRADQAGLVVNTAHATAAEPDVYPSDNVSTDEKDITLLKVPNVITPNGDGFNDKFVIKNLELYKENELVIFNRWNNVVYNKKNYTQDWTGHNLNAGTYFYILKVKDASNRWHSYNGYVMIMMK